MRNTDAGYGWMTKGLHWTAFVLILNQFTVAWLMLRTQPDETVAGWSQGTLYNWHKSIGVMLFVVAAARAAWRTATPLPEWAPNLGGGERRAISAVERILYGCMFVMPLSGFVFVMAGDYGVRFFNTWDLPNVIGPHETLALVAQRTHRLSAWLLGATLLAHWTITLRHTVKHRDRYVHRMLPFTHQR